MLVLSKCIGSNEPHLICSPGLLRCVAWRITRKNETRRATAENDPAMIPIRRERVIDPSEERGSPSVP